VTSADSLANLPSYPRCGRSRLHTLTDIRLRRAGNVCAIACRHEDADCFLDDAASLESRSQGRAFGRALSGAACLWADLDRLPAWPALGPSNSLTHPRHSLSSSTRGRGCQHRRRGSALGTSVPGGDEVELS